MAGDLTAGPSLSRVLLVDDDEMTRLLVSETLAPHEFEVMLAENGRQGLDLYHKTKPDLVLLDIMMPGLDGFACLQEMRALGGENLKHVPIVMLTGIEDALSVELAFSLGATDFISKPIYWALLPHRLRYILRNSQIARQLEQSRARLSEDEERLRLSMAAAKQGFYDLDLESGQAVVSDGYATMLGYDPATFRETHDAWLARLHPDDVELVSEEYRRYIVGEIPEYRVEFRQRCADGSWKWILSLGKIMARDAVGLPLRMMGTHTDIDSSKQAQSQLMLAASVFKEAAEGIVITDSGADILAVNQAYSRITGYDELEILGKNPRFLKSGNQNAAFYFNMWRTLKRVGYWQGELWNRRKDGEMFAVQTTISAVRDSSGHTTNYIGLMTEITEQKQHQDMIRHMAFYDALTALPNRALLADRLSQLLARATRQVTLGAVCYLDLDGFKPVNDRYGHAIGDQVLIEISRRLESLVRTEDTVARLGGDEFVVLLADLESHEESEGVLDRIMQAIIEPCMLENGAEARVTASIGVAYFPEDGNDADFLMRLADQAMYRAKALGRNRVCLHGKMPD